MNEVRRQLEKCLHGRICIIGLGNPDFGDDGFGVQLAEALVAAGLPDIVVAGSSPERFIGEITANWFDNVVFLDAVELDADAGSAVLLSSSQMAARFAQVSTHKLSLSLLAEWVEEGGTSKAWLLGVQPQSLKPGTGLSDPVQKTLGALKDLILKLRTRDLQVFLAKAM